MVEKTTGGRSLAEHLERARGREQRWSDFKRSVALVRNSGFSQEEQDSRISKLRSAYGIPSENEGEGSNVLSIAIAEAPKPQNRSRLKRARTIFRR